MEDQETMQTPDHPDDIGDAWRAGGDAPLAAAAPEPTTALARLKRLGDAGKAVEMAAYHKAPRTYLGVALPQIEPLVGEWRAALDTTGRVRLAAGLWDSDVHEARIAAAKMLTQARIPADEPLVWAELERWVSAFDGWAVADHACKAIERRLTAVPDRLDTVEGWTRHASPWVRRAALVATLPWSKLNHPDAAQRGARERVLGWAETMVDDRDWFIQKAVSWWVRSLSVHDAARARTFLEGPGRGLKAFARKDAARRLR